MKRAALFLAFTGLFLVAAPVLADVPAPDGQVAGDQGTPAADQGTPAGDTGAPAGDKGAAASDQGTPASDSGTTAGDGKTKDSGGCSVANGVSFSGIAMLLALIPLALRRRRS